MRKWFEHLPTFARPFPAWMKQMHPILARADTNHLYIYFRERRRSKRAWMPTLRTVGRALLIGIVISFLCTPLGGLIAFLINLQRWNASSAGMRSLLATILKGGVRTDIHYDLWLAGNTGEIISEACYLEATESSAFQAFWVPALFILFFVPTYFLVLPLTLESLVTFISMMFLFGVLSFHALHHFPTFATHRFIRPFFIVEPWRPWWKRLFSWLLRMTGRVVLVLLLLIGAVVSCAYGVKAVKAGEGYVIATMLSWYLMLSVYLFDKLGWMGEASAETLFPKANGTWDVYIRRGYLQDEDAYYEPT